MLIVLVEGSTPIGAANLARIRWATVSNGVANCETVKIRISVKGRPTSFYLLDNIGTALMHGDLAEVCPIVLDVGDFLALSPGNLTISHYPLERTDAPLFSIGKLGLIDGGARLLEHLSLIQGDCA